VFWLDPDLWTQRYGGGAPTPLHLMTETDLLSQSLYSKELKKTESLQNNKRVHCYQTVVTVQLLNENFVPINLCTSYIIIIIIIIDKIAHLEP
jgi:hypothetical protein